MGTEIYIIIKAFVLIVMTLIICRMFIQFYGNTDNNSAFKKTMDDLRWKDIIRKQHIRDVESLRRASLEIARLNFKLKLCEISLKRNGKRK